MPVASLSRSLRNPKAGRGDLLVDFSLKPKDHFPSGGNVVKLGKADAVLPYILEGINFVLREIL